MLKATRTTRWIPFLATGAVLLAMVGCGGGGGGGSPDLFLVSFLEDQRANLYRDQVLTFEFTTVIDVHSVDGDTFQVFKGTSQSPTPFTGLFEVSGTNVFFHPVVDENSPNRGLTPINPYGFDENTTYQVKIPSIVDTPTPLKVLRTPTGEPMVQPFTGAFSTGRDYTPNPAEANPIFQAFDPAVYDTRVNPPKGTEEFFDDILTFTPVPNLINPPINPSTNKPDLRIEHPTNVQVQVTFTSVMDPRSFRTQETGNIILEFNSPGTTTWNFIPTTVSNSPNGRTFILTAATPLAHETRVNRYRVRLDQSVYPLLSRGGKKLIEVVEKWDNGLGRNVRVSVTENDLSLWTAQVLGESGPLLTASFPLETFAKDESESDGDVIFSAGRLTAGNVKERKSEDTRACTWTWCNNAFREPLTQSFTSGNPNPNNKGPSKVQFHYNSAQHNQNPGGYKLKNAEALVGMNWGPLCSTVIQATYPKLNIHVMWSDRDSSEPNLPLNSPAGLPSATYNSNFDRNPPGFPVRDGSQPYQITQSSANVTWYPWKFQQPFKDYRIDKGLVFMAWTEQGGFTEQYLKWYAPPPGTPNTRVFSAPSATVNPASGLVGQYTYYWTQFEFKRIRSLAMSKYYRMTQDDNDRPIWNRVVVTPSNQNLPGGTDYQIQYRGARFSQYVEKKAGSKSYWEAFGGPLSQSSWSTNISSMDDLPAVAIQVEFEANPDKVSKEDLPYLDGIAFTFKLR